METSMSAGLSILENVAVAASLDERRTAAELTVVVLKDYPQSAPEWTEVYFVVHTAILKSLVG
jgi:hypothetical protein